MTRNPAADVNSDYLVQHRVLMDTSLQYLLQELEKSNATVPNVQYDGVTDLERTITKEEELRRADAFLDQFGWEKEAFQESARRLVYQICVGYLGVTGPLPIEFRSMVLDDSAAAFGLWPQSSLSESSTGKKFGQVDDSLFGFDLLHLFLHTGSDISTMLPAGSQDIVANPDLQAQLKMVYRALAFVLGGCEFVSQVSATWSPENSERTKRYHEANIRLATKMGRKKFSLHLSFLDNNNLTSNQVRNFNYDDTVVSGSNRQGKIGLEQEKIADRALEDHAQQIGFFGEMKNKYGLEDMTAVLHFGIVGRELSDTEFERAVAHLRQLLQLARKHGTTIAVENQGMTFAQYQKLLELFPESEYPEFGFCFDTAHAQIEFSKNGVDGIRKLWEVIGHRVVHVHIAQTIKKYDPETNECVGYKDLHPQLRCHHRGIKMSVFRWVIAQALENGQNASFTIEAQPNVADLLALLGRKPKRNLMSAEPGDLSLEPLEVFSPLLSTEVSPDEIQITRNAMMLFYSGVYKEDELEKMAWEETMQLTNWRKTDVHSESIEAHVLSGRLGELLRRIEYLITGPESKFALCRHTALLVLLFNKLETIQKKLLVDPTNKEMGAMYDAFEQIAKELMGKVNDLDLVVVGEQNDPAVINQALFAQGLQPRIDVEEGTGRTRDGTFKPGGLTEFFGKPHEAGFESLIASGLFYFLEDKGELLTDTGETGQSECKVEVMEGFAIVVPGFDAPIPLSKFAKILKIPETIEKSWANKKYRILHPTLILLSYYSEQKVYENGPAIFGGDYAKWAEKLHKAMIRAKLTFVGN